MTVEIVNLQQGSAEWRAYRKLHRNASDAPAMMNVSSHMKRSELVRAMATGIWPEPDEFQQAIYAKGHKFEALAREWLADNLGMDFFPVVGRQGKDSASLDGLTVDDAESMEHKMLNEALRAAMVDGCTGADLPMEYQVQMEHQCMVFDTVKRTLFVASDWTPNGRLVEIRYCWYTPNPILRAEIERGWVKLEADVQAFDGNELEVVEIVGEAPVTLPALRVQASSMVIHTNVDAFKALALDRIASINMAPQTDQEWADAKEAVRWNQTLANRIDESINMLHSSSAPAAAVEASLLEVKKAADQARIRLKNMIEAESKRKREAIASEAATELQNHAASLNEALGAEYIPVPTEDFMGALRNKRTEESQKAAVAAALTDARMAITATFEKIRTNLACLEKEAAGLDHLFQDRDTLVLQEPEFVFGTICARLRENADREQKIRAELLASRLAAPAAEVDARDATVTAPVTAIDTTPAAEPAGTAPADLWSAPYPFEPAADVAAAPAPASAPQLLAALVRSGAAAPAAAPAAPAVVAGEPSGETMTVSELGRLLKLPVTSAYVEGLGIQVAKVGAYRTIFIADFPVAVDKIIANLAKIKADYMAGRAAATA